LTIFCTFTDAMLLSETAQASILW